MSHRIHANTMLKELSPDNITRNIENPRLFIRPEEMDTLMASIRRYGIQVPINVYEDSDNKYVLIDGERRWRCARKLNLKKIPALVQPKPSDLANLLLMFNIHALREQWDYLTIANKLPNVISLFAAENDGKQPTEHELCEITGLTVGQIRRCRFLLDLPKKYMDILMEELALPKSRQKLSEDFFIEMERSLKTVLRRVPSSLQNINNVRDALIEKFKNGTIVNITDFRRLSKIATSINNVGTTESQARKALGDIFNPRKDIGINDVFVEQFELRYDERKLSISIDSIYEYLKEYYNDSDGNKIDSEIVKKLRKLKKIIDQVLGE